MSNNNGTRLDIPEEVLDVAWRAFGAHEDDYVAALADAITAAAPLIVAAELRRFIGVMEVPIRWGGFSRAVPGLEVAVGAFRQRADELDPPGGAA